MVEISRDVLIYDIETYVVGDRPDSSKDRLRIFGCYSYKTKKPYLLTDKKEIQNIINAHKFLVGFNNVGDRKYPGYDNPILVREGIDLKFKICIDMRKIFKKRAGAMMIKEGMLSDLIMSYSLDFITKLLKLVDKEDGKKEINYDVFKKETWTPEEVKEIKEYTIRDIEVTKKLYEWLEEYFNSFKDFVNEEDVKKKRYLTSSIAGFAYNAICHAMKWNNEMSNSDEKVELKGGYVSYPAGERFEGNIYCLDFNSLYPHIAIQCNLFGRIKGLEDIDRWNGNNKWKVEGAYNSKELSSVAKLFIKWYADRTVYKKNYDKREYSIKIILNTGSYGILNTPYYPKTFDAIAGRDCPSIGRQWTKYARKIFIAEGYKMIYTDTDSVYIIDVFNDKEKMLKVRDRIINDIKATVPFPQDTFDMGIDDEIKYMYFFPKGKKEDKHSDDEMDEQDFIDKPKGLLKKNYIYVAKVFDKEGKYTGEDKVVIKNLGIRKKSISPLSRKIFWEHLVPKIKEGQIKFSKKYLKDLMEQLLKDDINLALLRKDVGGLKDYKGPTSIQAQISTKYGPGTHFLIANLKNLGVGKGKSFCTLKEFNKHNLKLTDIDYDGFWNELDYFIKPIVTKNIFEF